MADKKTRKRGQKPEWQQQIARERITILFKEASKAARRYELNLANRYIFLARKMAMAYNVRLTKEQKRKFCHHCYHYFKPGKNVEVRTNPKTKAVEYKCLDCKKITRYPYIKEKSKTRFK